MKMTADQAAQILGIYLPADAETIRRAFIVTTRKLTAAEAVKRAIDARRILDALNRPS